MKLDYKSPQKATGLMQRRPLSHIILGGLALLCLIFAISLRGNKSQNQPYNPNNLPPIASNTLSRDISGNGTHANGTSDNVNQEKGTYPLLPAIVLSSDSTQEPNKTKAVIEKEKALKQTIMTLAQVKMTESNLSKANSKTKVQSEPSATIESAPIASSATSASNGEANTAKITKTNQDATLIKSTENTDGNTKTQDQVLAKQEYDTITIRKGDSLAKIFKRQGYSQKDLDVLMQTDLKTSKKFKSLQVKQTLKIYYNENHQVQALALEGTKGIPLKLGKIQPILIAKKDKETKLPNVASAATNLKQNDLSKTKTTEDENITVAAKSENLKDTAANTANTTAEKIEASNAEKQIAFGKGTVKDSLYLAGKRAGLDKQVISQLVEIFGWNIDFALVQPTDSFRVLFEEKRVEGEKVGNGSILAAEMTFKGKVYRAIRYTDKSGQTGYFSPEGHGLKENFLRYPLAFSHVSSGFGPRRHPVQRHRIREHKGVDFAAPKGTPVECTGDGKVTFVGTRGGYGRVIEVQHGDQYSTLYAHLSKFAPKLKAGCTVKKGQVIGNVGRTGLATGNHLHYEFLVAGVHRDPLKVLLPKKNPIPDSNKRHFLAHAKEMLKLMDRHENKVNMVRNEYPRNE